jgi:PKD repeat protein
VIFETSFKEAGKFSVGLSRTDEYGRESRVTESIDVELPPPPQAGFRIATRPSRIGDTVALINESSESAYEFVWKHNGREFSRDRHPTLPVGDYGPHSISLTALDHFGQSHVSQKTLELPRPAPPVANFDLPSTVNAGETVTLIDQSFGEIDTKSTWYLNGTAIGSGRTATFVGTVPGEHTIRLVTRGPGGEAMQEKTLLVQQHPAPHAGFTVGNLNPFVGDVIRITDTSSGPIDRITFDVFGLTTPTSVELKYGQKDRYFDIQCSRIGELNIIQKVVGPGGQDELRATILVSSRSINPTADFEVRLVPERGSTVATFLNRSRGTIERMVFDAGDGSDAREISSDEEIVHAYSVGTWTPRITVFGPSGENLPPSTWIGQEILVAKPIATWVRNLAWQVPVGLTFGAASMAVMGFFRGRRLRDHQKRISGHLVIRPVNKPRDVKHIEFGGENYEEVVELDSASSLKLSTRDDGFLHHQIELVRNGQAIQVADLDDSTNVKLGNYFVSYSA